VHRDVVRCEIVWELTSVGLWAISYPSLMRQTMALVRFIITLIKNLLIPSSIELEITSTEVAAEVATAIIPLIESLIITLIINILLMIFESVHQERPAHQTCASTKQSASTSSKSVFFWLRLRRLLLSVVRRLLRWVARHLAVRLLWRIAALVAAVLLRWVSRWRPVTWTRCAIPLRGRLRARARAA